MRRVRRLEADEVDRQADAVRVLVPVVGARAPTVRSPTAWPVRAQAGRSADEVHAAFQFLERLARRRRTAAESSATSHWSRPSRAASIDVGVLDVDAQHVRDQPADERELLLALPQDALHALAHALALGLQVLQQLLPRQQPGAVLLGGAELLADCGDLLAERGRLLALVVELLLLLGDVRRALVELRLELGPLRLRGSRSRPATDAGGARPRRACWAAMFFRSISIAPRRLLTPAQPPHQVEDRRPCAARSPG